MTKSRKPPHPDTRFRINIDCPKHQKEVIKITSDGELDLDEIVLGGWLHIEQLGRGSWFVRICDRAFWVKAGKKKSAKITYEEIRK